MRRGTHRNVVQAMLKNAAGEIDQSQIRHTIRKKVIGCATDRLSFCIIITGKEHYVISLENLSSCGTFWARIHRTKEEEKSFVSAMTRMG